MDPVTIGLVGAGLGVGKGLLDQQKEKRDRELQAQIAMWSPWTGMAPQQVQEADVLGSAMQGGMSGAALGQNMQMNDAYTAMLQQQALRQQQPQVVQMGQRPGDAWFAMGPHQNPSFYQTR